MHIKFIEPLNCRGGGQLLFLLSLCLQIYYWQCLGFRSPQKGMLISVLSPVGYFFVCVQKSEFILCNIHIKKKKEFTLFLW